MYVKMRTKKDIIKLLKILLDEQDTFINKYNIDTIAMDNTDYIEALQWVLDSKQSKPGGGE